MTFLCESSIGTLAQAIFVYLLHTTDHYMLWAGGAKFFTWKGTIKPTHTIKKEKAKDMHTHFIRTVQEYQVRAA